MSDQDLAELYDDNRDGPEEWGGPRRERILSGTVAIRFTAEELAHIRRLAQERRVTYADIVRLGCP